MKKLLLLLFLIPNLVMAEVCDISINHMSEVKVSQANLSERITSRCADNDILHFILYKDEPDVKNGDRILFRVQTDFCNFNKTITVDDEGTNFNLACVYKDNRK